MCLRAVDYGSDTIGQKVTVRVFDAGVMIIFIRYMKGNMLVRRVPEPQRKRPLPPQKVNTHR